MDSHNVWPSQVRHGLAGESVDKSLTMHRAGQQILVTSASSPAAVLAGPAPSGFSPSLADPAVRFALLGRCPRPHDDQDESNPLRRPTITTGSPLQLYDCGARDGTAIIQRLGIPFFGLVLLSNPVTPLHQRQ